MINSDMVLVTGGAGMIGANLVHRLAGLGIRVKVIDNLWRGKLDNLKDVHGKFVIDIEKDFHHVDLASNSDLGPYFSGVDTVYHLADIVAGIGYVFSNQGSVFRQNLLINSNTINAVRESSVRKFLYVGTACSFPAQLQSGVDARPLVEEDQYPASPESAYGWSKLMGEYETLLFEQESKVKVSVLSLHNVYGTLCDYEEEKSQVIPALIRKAIVYPDSEFTVWGSGRQGRAFVYVDDVVDALLLAHRKGLGEGVIQIGPDRCTSIQEIVQEIVKLSGKKIEVKYDLTKPEGDKGRCADYTKARELLGWTPKITVQEGLAQTFEWIEKDMRSKN